MAKCTCFFRKTNEVIRCLLSDGERELEQEYPVSPALRELMPSLLTLHSEGHKMGPKARSIFLHATAEFPQKEVGSSNQKAWKRQRKGHMEDSHTVQEFDWISYDPLRPHNILIFRELPQLNKITLYISIILSLIEGKTIIKAGTQRKDGTALQSSFQNYSRHRRPEIKFLTAVLLHSPHTLPPPVHHHSW